MATEDPRSPEITPGAARMLDDVTEDLKIEVLRRAERRIVSPGIRERAISVVDIIEVLSELGVTKSSHRRREEGARRLLSLYLAMATLFAAIASIALIVAAQVLTPQDNRSSAILSLAVSLTGVVVAITTGVIAATLRATQRRLAARLLRLRPHEFNSKALLEETFLRRWVDLEAIIRRVVAYSRGESSLAQPMPDIIRAFGQGTSLVPDEVADLIDLLKLRNRIVHSSTPPSSVPELKLAIQRAEDLIKRFDHLPSAL